MEKVAFARVRFSFLLSELGVIGIKNKASCGCINGHVSLSVALFEVPTCSWTVQFRVLGYKSYFLPRSDRLCHSLCLNRFVPYHQGLYLPGLTDGSCCAGKLGHCTCPSLLLVSMWVCAQCACEHACTCLWRPQDSLTYALQVCGMRVYMYVCVLLTADLYTYMRRSEVDTENCPELFFHFTY